MEKKTNSKGERFSKLNEFLEVNQVTGEVRMKGSKTVLKNLRYFPENDEVREYRYRPLEDGEDLEDFMNELEDIETVSNSQREEVGEEQAYLITEDEGFYFTDMGRVLTEDGRVFEEVEVWKPVVGFESKYEVSSFGNVRNKRTGRYLHQTPNTSGYLRVQLYNKNGKGQKYFFVHRLVAQAFIQNPNNLDTVNHIDQNKLNNNSSNLNWMSLADNIRYSQNKRVLQCDPNTGGLINEFPSNKEASRLTGTNVSSISSVCNGRYKKANGYKWRYVC